MIKNSILQSQSNKTMAAMTTQIFSREQLEEQLMEEVFKIANQGITMTRPGSIKYLMYGSTPSAQSISIKMGTFGEKMMKLIISNSPHLELLPCGHHCIDEKTNKKKDVDLVWKDEEKKIIYYREMKGNVKMDTEKIPATIDKIKNLKNYLQQKYSDYEIDFGLLAWSTYTRGCLIKNGIAEIKKFEKSGIKVEHMKEMMELLSFEWSEEQYHNFFRIVGQCIDNRLRSRLLPMSARVDKRE